MSHDSHWLAVSRWEFFFNPRKDVIVYTNVWGNRSNRGNRWAGMREEKKGKKKEKGPPAKRKCPMEEP